MRREIFAATGVVWVRTWIQAGGKESIHEMGEH
jgi:hypothetical protein